MAKKRCSKCNLVIVESHTDLARADDNYCICEDIITIKPKSDITCSKMNCIERENKNKIKLSCVNCSASNICMMAK